ncbi:response regulator [uncultured Nocardioides sp.]|uniref:response regulator n=1 Tax=uncultured Nocardioides sp. TaxID=198441 RepID=UPI002630849D|nr:response regulator [uncultured Nocardioides sp.]
MTRPETPRVLVVDDDDDIRFLITIALETTAGWEVVVATGGAEAVALAAERQPDAILLDLMMPGMDGLATTEALRAQPSTAQIPVILLTAKAAAGGEVPWEGAAISGALTKPFDPMTLAADVSALLGW